MRSGKLKGMYVGNSNVRAMYYFHYSVKSMHSNKFTVIFTLNPQACPQICYFGPRVCCYHLGIMFRLRAKPYMHRVLDLFIVCKVAATKRISVRSESMVIEWGEI